MSSLKWLAENYGSLLLALSALVGAAEVIVRLTPTKKDDSAVERIGKLVSGLLNFLKIPNNKK